MESTFETVSAEALEPKELVLTCQGLQFVNWECVDADFEVFNRDGKSCRVHSALAEFLSPKVSRLRKCDPLCCCYTFNNSDLLDVFESLVSTMQAGRRFPVDQSNFVCLLRLSVELENSELLSSLLGTIKAESLSLENALLLLRASIAHGTACSDRFGNLRDFVASHFYEIEREILDSLDIETLQLILSSSSLKIEDEDSLYDFVRSRSENDLRFTSLFEFVYFEYLSVDRIENFASFVSENLLENISTGIWTRICGRLILKTNLHNPHNAASEVKFDYNSSKPLDGIIAHLTRECGGNVHDKGIVNVTSSSINTSSQHPKNAVDLEGDREFATGNEVNSWIRYDFKDRRVIPTSYSIKSQSCGPYGCHLRSWVIEGSNNGESWTEIDRRDGNNDLKDSCVTKNFTISSTPKERFRFIRLKQTGKNHCNNHHIHFRSPEIFGTLCEKSTH